MEENITQEALNVMLQDGTTKDNFIILSPIILVI